MYQQVEIMSKFRWSNIPVPEGHLITLIAGVALNIWKPFEFWQAVWQRQTLGWILLSAGILLALWATATFQGMDFSKPTAVMTTGAYALSRNPMYVAWHVMHLAVALLVNTWWLMILLPIPLLFTHFFVIRKEEAQLEVKFGDVYRQYRARVRRYL
jgi:protein-S-isoprenylcysteine O-methyltransferase Ste14